MSNSNWFGRVLNKLTRNEPAVPSRIYNTGRTASGIYVDAERALRNATVWACIQYLTKAVGQLPWRVMEEAPNSGARVAKSNPADRLLHLRPNPEMGAFTFRQTLLGWALRYGNGYAEIQWDNRGAPFALWPVHPDRVTPRRNEFGELYYEVSNFSGGAVAVAAADMFHVRGMGDGPVGMNVIEYAAQSIGWAQATELFGSTFFGEGMNPSGIVESTKGLTPGAMEVLRAELDRLYKGPKGKRTAILDAGMSFKKLATNPDESQFIETMQFQVPEICRWFGVPPHKVMHLLNATFSNIEHQSIEVVVDCVAPWVKVFEEEANYKLFPPPNRQGLFTKMNLAGLLRGDHASRAAFYKIMFELGMTINQILALEDIDGIGANGDVSFVSNNVQTLERAIAGPPAQTAPKLGDVIPDPEAAPPPAPNGAGRRLPN